MSDRAVVATESREVSPGLYIPIFKSPTEQFVTNDLKFDTIAGILKPKAVQVGFDESFYVFQAPNFQPSVFARRIDGEQSVFGVNWPTAMARILDVVSPLDGTSNIYAGADIVDVLGDSPGWAIATESEVFVVSGNVAKVIASHAFLEFDGGATTDAIGYYADFPSPGLGTLTNFFGFYAPDLSQGEGTNIYYFWGDSRGVFRIKEDATVDGGNAQAILALYNPRFTKYTPGASDLERGILQWKANVLEFGAESQGSGTLRDFRLKGKYIHTPVPTSVIADADLANGEYAVSVDEGTNKLKFKVKYSGGTVKTVDLSLV